MNAYAETIGHFDFKTFLTKFGELWQDFIKIGKSSLELWGM